MVLVTEWKITVFFCNHSVDSKYYRDAIINGFLKEQTTHIFGNTPWCLIQDNAPTHRATATQHLCSTLPDYVSSAMWPANSPDLSLLDYYVHRRLQEKIYRRHNITTIAELRNAIVEEWANMSRRHLRTAALQWRRRLQAVVAENGGHIEHLFC